VIADGLGLGHLAARGLAFLARLGTLLQLKIVVLRTLVRAGFACLGAGQACGRDQGALPSHQIGREVAEFLAVDRQDGGAVMVSMTILDLVEAVMERLVADRVALLARLDAITMQLIVVVGMLRSGLGRPQRDACQADPNNTENLATVHHKISARLR
jgi:hypothetical protein